MKRSNIKIILSVVVLLGILACAVIYMPSITVQDIILWYKEHLNYWTVMLLMAIESSFIPFPSEIVIPPAAYFSMHNGNMSIYLIVVFATLGALVGALINYYIAKIIGRPLIHAFAESRIGHICMLSSEKVSHAEEYFEKHGAISTFLGRLIPAVRQLISIPAGLARMSLVKFCVFTSLGAGIWNIVLALLGYWLSLFVPESELFSQIEHYNKYLTYAGYALAGVILIYIMYHLFVKKKSSSSK